MAIMVGGSRCTSAGRGAAVDLEAAIVGFLDAATTSLDIAVHEREWQPIADGQVVVAGSFSYTVPASRLDDEDLLVIGDLETTDPAEVGLQTQLASSPRSASRPPG